MKYVVALAFGLGTVAAAGGAFAEGPPVYATQIDTASLEQQLHERNARLDASLGSEGSTNQTEMKDDLAKANDAVAHARETDEKNRQAYVADVVVARKDSWRKRGNGSLGIGLGLVGAASVGWLVQALEQPTIVHGGFATGGDIGSRVSEINALRGSSIAAFTVGGVLTLTGILVLTVGVPNVKALDAAPATGGIQFRDGGLAW